MLQSAAQEVAVSPGSHLPLPHLHAPQSPGHFAQSSPVVHLPSPHLHAPQSLGHLPQSSPAEHEPSPHLQAPQSELQLSQFSPPLQRPSPHETDGQGPPAHLPQAVAHVESNLVLQQKPSALQTQAKSPHLPQSPGHVAQFSVLWQVLSPQIGTFLLAHNPQSLAQLLQVSVPPHRPSPQPADLGQSCTQLSSDSSCVHLPSPQFRVLQEVHSLAQVLSHETLQQKESVAHTQASQGLPAQPLVLPAGHVGLQAPQSLAQLEQVSSLVISHLPSPQVVQAPQSFGQDQHASSGPHLPSPQPVLLVVQVTVKVTLPVPMLSTTRRRIFFGCSPSWSLLELPCGHRLVLQSASAGISAIVQVPVPASAIAAIWVVSLAKSYTLSPPTHLPEPQAEG